MLAPIAMCPPRAAAYRLCMTGAGALRCTATEWLTLSTESLSGGPDKWALRQFLCVVGVMLCGACVGVLLLAGCQKLAGRLAK